MNGLTPRQTQIMRLVCQGYIDKEIAAMLHLALSTIRQTNVVTYERLGARNRANAVARFLGVEVPA